jgi:hypothetical protein
LKKITGKPADEHYRRVDEDGVVHNLEPEFARMSLKPGIAASWFDKFELDVVSAEGVVFDNKKFAVPRYYDRLLERRDPDLLQELKDARSERAVPFLSDHSADRLTVRESVESARLKNNSLREYENGSANRLGKG